MTTAPDPTEVVVETVTVPHGSPALGRAPVDVVRPAGAVLLGVSCDATPQLVGTDVGRGVRAGDKLVVVTRRGRLSRLRGAV